MALKSTGILLLILGLTLSHFYHLGFYVIVLGMLMYAEGINIRLREKMSANRLADLDLQNQKKKR